MEEIYRSQFRLPYSLYEQLKAAADMNHRSVNAELVARLGESFGSSALQASAGQEGELRVVEQDGTVTTLTDDRITQAIIRAFEAVEGRSALGPGRPARGPQPRRKHPKQ